VALDVAPEVGEGGPEADMVVYEEVDATGLYGSVEGRLEGEAMEAAGSCVTDGVRLDERRGHREPETLPEFMAHRVGDEVDPRGLDGANWRDREPVPSDAVSNVRHGGVRHEVASDSHGCLPLA
jgi:hypothetical protein